MVRLHPSSVVDPTHKSGSLPTWIGVVGAIALSFPLISYVFDAFLYQQAEQAYEAAQCEQAIAGFSTLVERWRPHDWQDYGTRSQSRMGECAAYQEMLPQLDGSPSDVLRAIAPFLKRFPNSALIPSLRQQATPRLEGLTADGAIDVEGCDALVAALTHRLLPISHPPLPALRYTCGQTYQAAGLYTKAVEQFQHFLTDYPGHAQTPAVEAALATALIDEADANNAGALPAPLVSGFTAPGTTQVQIRNSSPQPMRIIFRGTETRFEELPACEDCQVYTTEVPESCPEKGPIATYTLKPGDYQVLVRSLGDRHVTPFTGEWTLADGYHHSNCFYIVEQPYEEHPYAAWAE